MTNAMLRQTLVINEDQPLLYKRNGSYKSDLISVSLYHGGYLRKKKAHNWYGDTGRNMEPWCEGYLSFVSTMKDFGSNQGAHKFQVYPQFLAGHARLAWDKLAANAEGTTNADFSDTMEAFLLEITLATMPPNT